MESIQVIIELTQGKEAYVDIEDAPRFSFFKWQADKGGNTYYAKRTHWTDCKKGKRHKVQMHRVIANAKPGEQVDHKDGNGLNNRRNNLRICSHTQNSQNRKVNDNNTSGYKGVNFDNSARTRKPWRARISVDNKRIILGRFDTKEQAALAYNEAAIKYFGKFAKLNEVS